MRGIKKKPFFLSYPQRQTAEFESRRPTRRRHDDGWKRARPDDSNRFFFNGIPRSNLVFKKLKKSENKKKRKRPIRQGRSTVWTTSVCSTCAPVASGRPVHGESASVLEVSARARFRGVVVSSSCERPLRLASRFLELDCCKDQTQGASRRCE